ncbi:LacI family DNA-binding transcriptional regulator [Pseudarthrobacter sp. Y6]|uniref:LacI family DNA-binding transcriptional regulator n=1 Tax=Pseudarthrobacter sp. Y6 TaxID=3418422 RepID=UPI003CEA0379
MDYPKARRITQRHIAERAAVSQSVVSLVLNGKADAISRIPKGTRDRVMAVIRETGYVADPAARRLAGVGNKIFGVFTYEPAFADNSTDFYTPLLLGIEAKAEELGCDLLMFTSAPVENGRRRIFHENNRLALADGCLLLGREMAHDDLLRLVESRLPFVAVGRRDVEGVPYVGVDYVAATSELARRARELGHERFYYLHFDSPAESVRDRKRAMDDLRALPFVEVAIRASDGTDIAADWAAIREFRPTVLFVDRAERAESLYRLATEAGLAIPGDLSMVVLEETSQADGRGVDFTRLSPPRGLLGSSAVGLLGRILSSNDNPSGSELRTLLDCEVKDGATLAVPNKGNVL